MALAIIGVSAVIGCDPGPAPSPDPSFGAGSAARPLDLSSAKAFANSIADSQVSLSRSENMPDEKLRYRSIEYSTEVFNAGSPEAFTAFITISRTVTVYPTSAASISTAQAHPPTFATPSGRERWMAAGSPALGSGGSNNITSLTPGQFSFVLQGTRLSYQQASNLSGTPSEFSTQLLSHLRPAARGPDPPATLVLKQLGYLVAVAPLSVAAQSAAWHMVGALPGLEMCGAGTDLSGRHGVGLCVDADGEQTEILVNKHTGSVLAIEVRLQRPSAAYPTVSSGSLILSITFTGA
ncbi:MAG TPA: hypothetical protein VGM14_28860 [Streptosporangiaceae bacterium]